MPSTRSKISDFRGGAATHASASNLCRPGRSHCALDAEDQRNVEEKPRLRLTVPLTARDRGSERGTTVAVFSGLPLFFIENFADLSCEGLGSEELLNEWCIRAPPRRVGPVRAHSFRAPPCRSTSGGSVFVEQLTNLSHQPVRSKRFLKERYPFGEHTVMNCGLFCVA